MLTLDTAQQERSQRQSRVLENRARDSELLRSDIRNKEVTVAKDGDLTTTSLLRQLGTPLSSAEVIRRLQRMNRNLLCEVARADDTKMGIYVIQGDTKRFVCGMERGFMPERSVRHMKKEQVPDPDIRGHWREVETFQKETRGWRTVLRRLIAERLITKSQVEVNFPPNLDSKNWQLLT